MTEPILLRHSGDELTRRASRALPRRLLVVLITVLCAGCQTAGRGSDQASVGEGVSVLVLLPVVFNGSPANEVYPAGDRQTPETMRRRIDAMLSVMRSEPFNYALQVERVGSPNGDRVAFFDRSYDWLLWTRTPFLNDKVIWFKARKGDFGNSLLFVDDLRSPYRQTEWSRAVRSLADRAGSN